VGKTLEANRSRNIAHAHSLLHQEPTPFLQPNRSQVASKRLSRHFSKKEPKVRSTESKIGRAFGVAKLIGILTVDRSQGSLNEQLGWVLTSDKQWLANPFYSLLGKFGNLRLRSKAIHFPSRLQLHHVHRPGRTHFQSCRGHHRKKGERLSPSFIKIGCFEESRRKLAHRFAKT
jgi:hypothetical protein